MPKLRNMQAFVDIDKKDGYVLISYNTAIAQKSGCWLLIYDYPTITSKKHLRAFLTDYGYIAHSLDDILRQARKRKQPYIVYNTSERVAMTFDDKDLLRNSVYYLRMLNDVANPIL